METHDAIRPLGIRPEVVLKDEQLRALRLLEAYDLAPVRDRLVQEASMPSSWIDGAIIEFRRYLGLQVVAPGPMPMFSKHVDDVWHACLLFSRLYADLCTTVFGWFLHHDPRTERHEHDATSNEWTAFRETYERYYGPLDRIWTMGRAAPKQDAG